MVNLSSKPATFEFRMSCHVRLRDASWIFLVQNGQLLYDHLASSQWGPLQLASPSSIHRTVHIDT